MQSTKLIKGFSKLSKAEKIDWIVQNFFDSNWEIKDLLKSFWHENTDSQRIFDGFSENTISNFFMPFGVAPNFIINEKPYVIPMVIEESSVVAAASSAAKYWMSRGGFHAQIISTIKVGQVHFTWKGNNQLIHAHFPKIITYLKEKVAPLTKNMETRGGGILAIELLDFTEVEPNYYQLKAKFETCDSMGANFINSVLEEFGQHLKNYILQNPEFDASSEDIEIIMAILSNYTPECLVKAWVECPIEKLGAFGNVSGKTLAHKFCKAIKIAQIDPYRATTHNKGIYNGVDAVVLATGNDFRAIEACGHTFAARNGTYQSLSYCKIENDIFKFWIELPLAIGTVGGLTNLHPLAKTSLALLGNPNARELMQIIAAAGLAQNFAAVKSLVTTGIQKGHMKMHLANILQHLHATEQEMQSAIQYFEDKVVSFKAVREFMKNYRSTS